MSIIFPNRVWEPARSGYGWVSRPATAEDVAQRREVKRSIDLGQISEVFTDHEKLIEALRKAP